MRATPPSPGRGERVRFEARPAGDAGLWALVRIWPYGKEEAVAYGSRERCEALARRLQAREDRR